MNQSKNSKLIYSNGQGNWKGIPVFHISYTLYSVCVQLKKLIRAHTKHRKLEEDKFNETTRCNLKTINPRSKFSHVFNHTEFDSSNFGITLSQSKTNTGNF